MELKHLKTFLTLSHLKNYTQTASKLNYAQSNISSHIQQLENELHVKLFEQIGKKVYLTPDGEKLIPYATRMLSLSEDIDLLYHTEPIGGKITIGASESLSIYILPPILRAFSTQNPEVKLFIKIVDISDYVPMLCNNLIDIAFALDNKVSFSNINSIQSNLEPLSLLVAPSHPLAKLGSLSWEDMQPYPFVLTGKDCCYRGLLEHELSLHHIEPLIMLETPSVPVIKESTISGLGVCFLPDYVVKSEIEKGELIRLPLSVSSSVYSQLLIHKDKWIYPTLQKLIDFF